MAHQKNNWNNWNNWNTNCLSLSKRLINNKIQYLLMSCTCDLDL